LNIYMPAVFLTFIFKALGKFMHFVIFLFIFLNLIFYVSVMPQLTFISPKLNHNFEKKWILKKKDNILDGCVQCAHYNIVM
jgi:hypothetical protein